MKNSAILLAVSFLTMGSVFANGKVKETPGSSSRSGVSIRSFPRPGFEIVIAPSVQATLDIYNENGNVVYHHYFHDNSYTSKVYNLSQLPEGKYRVKTIANKIITTSYITVGNE